MEQGLAVTVLRAAPELGGSYWLHYLLAVAPGLVLLTTAARPTSAGQWGLGVAAAGTAVALGGFALAPPAPGDDQAVSAYLHSHATATDTVVVAFGQSEHPPRRWADESLPAPVEPAGPRPRSTAAGARRHPRGLERTAMGRGRRRVVGTWGAEPIAAQHQLDQRYREVATDGDWHIFGRS